MPSPRATTRTAYFDGILPTESVPLVLTPKLPAVRKAHEGFGIKGNSLGFVLWMLCIAGAIVLGIVSVKSKVSRVAGIDPLLLSYTLFVTAFQISRLLNAFLYRYSYRQALATADTRRDSPFEPTISFVIPCKNEEGAIENTVRKCFNAEYPAHKLEVIVINDGSTDRTGEILDSIIGEFPTLTVIHWNINRGKRHGMAEGFRRAKGEIVIQLDSDSFIEPSRVRDLILPFENSEIGAVCAHADPLNADYNWLTKMQAAYYFMSFRILKAAESAYGMVFCCSGCSSAYRRSIILPILDVWLKETFLGLPVTLGRRPSTHEPRTTGWI